MKAISNSYRFLRRRWRASIGRDLHQGVQVKHPYQTLGDEKAEWSTCQDLLSRESVVYSLGVGEEISFDLQLIKNVGLTVHGFDPTPRSIEWLSKQTLPAQFVFHPYGVAGRDGVLQFTPPQNPRHVSHTLLKRNSPWPAISVPVYRLSTIMKMLGHQRIELLKMDIEGAEYEVIQDLLESRVEVHQLLVEFHHRWPEVGLNKTEIAIRQLNSAGYKIFSVSVSGEEYGFLHVSQY